MAGASAHPLESSALLLTASFIAGRPPPCVLRRVVKLVRAMRKGWIKRRGEAEAEEPRAYLIWEDDGEADSSKGGSGYLR